MFKNILTLLGVITLSLTARLQAAVIDLWSFTYTNGTDVGSAVSEQGSDWGAVSGGNAVVQDEELVFAYDGVTQSTFRNAPPSSDAGATSGVYRLSWTYTAVDFTLTHASSPTNSGRVGFGIRNTNNNSDVNVRLVGVTNEVRLERSDATSTNLAFATFGVSTLTNLKVSLLFDFDKRGAEGSYRVAYTPSGGSEILAVTNGTLPTNFVLNVVRMVQQTRNGGTFWVAGDFVRVDNILLESVEPEPVIASARLTSATGIQFAGETGTVYALQYELTASPGVWMDAGIERRGTGSNTLLFDPAGFSTERTYRVISK